MTVSHCRAEKCFLDGISSYISAVGWLLDKFVSLFFFCLLVGFNRFVLVIWIFVSLGGFMCNGRFVNWLVG
jgi:hypothetical protein